MPDIVHPRFSTGTCLDVACSEVLRPYKNPAVNRKYLHHRPSVEIRFEYTMAFRYLFFALIWTSLSSASASASLESGCNFAGIDVDGAIAKLIAKFPESELIGPEKYYPVFAGFEISGFNASGFDKLHRYGPVIPYCVNGTRRIQVDFINAGDVVVATPWRHCSGHQGTLSLRSALSRFTVQFRVEHNGRDDETMLTYEGPTIPVITENIHVKVDGAGPNASRVATILAMVFPAVTMQMWNDQFYYPLSRALYRALNYTCDSC